RFLSSSSLSAISILKGRLMVILIYRVCFLYYMHLHIKLVLEENNIKRTYQEIEENPSQIKIRTSVINSTWLEIAIADNGVGISKEFQQRIFDPFFTTKPIGKGTGMGMSISYQIITEKHCGKLECFSTSGKGTEFIIQIPLQLNVNQVV
ncbi:hypothetical protein H6G95_33345, partial [Nostoc linckia FACHB-391]